MDLAYSSDASEAVGEFRDATTVRILDAAYDALSHGGVRRTTMNQIAETAGLGVATVYRRFPREGAAGAGDAAARGGQGRGRGGPGDRGRGDDRGAGCSGLHGVENAVADRPLLVRLLRGDSDYDGESVPPGGSPTRSWSWSATTSRTGSGTCRRRAVTCPSTPASWPRSRPGSALSLVLAPEGWIPMHDDAATLRVRDDVPGAPARQRVPVARNDP